MLGSSLASSRRSRPASNTFMQPSCAGGDGQEGNLGQGKVNVRAERLSSTKQDHTDIRLAPKVFNLIDRRYNPHSVDHFATRDNNLLDRFVSWRPDPSALAVDAFMIPQKGKNPYCFPPISCIPRQLREVLRQ